MLEQLIEVIVLWIGKIRGKKKKSKKIEKGRQ